MGLSLKEYGGRIAANDGSRNRQTIAGPRSRPKPFAPYRTRDPDQKRDYFTFPADRRSAPAISSRKRRSWVLRGPPGARMSSMETPAQRQRAERNPIHEQHRPRLQGRLRLALHQRRLHAAVGR